MKSASVKTRRKCSSISPGRAGGESAEAGKGGGRFVVRLPVVSGAVRRREDIKQVVDEFLILGFRESARAVLGSHAIAFLRALRE